MNQKEWYAKLEEWAFDDARLHRMPLAFLPILAEHLANEQAAEHSAQADGAECVCENHTDNDGWRCNVCGLLSPHRQPTDVPTKGVYCRNCEDTIEYNEMKPFRRDDDAVDMLCPGCDLVLVEGE